MPLFFCPFPLPISAVLDCQRLQIFNGEPPVNTRRRRILPRRAGKFRRAPENKESYSK